MSWRPCTPLAAALLVIVLCGLWPAPADGGETTLWIGATGDWLDANNWSDGLPDSDANALVENGGTAQLSAGSAEVNWLTVGAAGSGTLSWTGGVLQAGGIALGPNGVLIVNETLNVDEFSVGSIVQSGGSAHANAVNIGSQADSNGTWHLTGGQITVDGAVVVGAQGLGRLHQAGGSVSANLLAVGFYPSSRGIYELDDGNLTLTDNLYLGIQGAAHFVQSGGRTQAKHVYIGSVDANGGFCELHGGEISLSGNLFTGIGGKGHFHQSGGIVRAKDLHVGSEPGSSGQYELLDGNVVLTGQLYVGVGAEATFTQSGGSVETTRITLADQVDSDGTYLLSDGEVHTPGSLVVGVRGTGRFAQTGGQVTADALVFGFDSTGASGGAGSYELSGGQLLLRDVKMRSGSGSLVVDGGQLRQADANDPPDPGDPEIRFQFLNSDGHFTFGGSGGRLAAAADTLNVAGRNTFTQTGCTLTARSMSVGGAAPNSAAAYTLGGGELLIGLPQPGGSLIVAGGGTFTQTGGQATLTGADLVVAPAQGGSQAVCNLSGGQFRTVAVAPDPDHPEDLYGGNLVISAQDGNAVLNVASGDVQAGRLLVGPGGASPARQAVVHLDGGHIVLTGEGGTRDANYYSIGSDIDGRIEGSGTIVSPAGLFLRRDAVLAPQGGMLTLDAELGFLLDDAGMLKPRETVPNALDIPAGAGLRTRGKLTGPVQNAGTLAAYGGSLYLYGHVVNTGTLSNAPGSNLFVHPASLDHAGDIEVNAGGTVSFDQPIVNLAARSVSLKGGALAAPQITNAAGGALSGSGTLSGAIVNEGSADFYGFAQIFGHVLNAASAHLNVWNGDLLVVGDTTNQGHIKVLNGRATFQGGLDGNGTIDIDPATVFVGGDLHLGSDGVITADANSALELMRDFVNASTRAGDFDLSLAAVSFRGSGGVADPQVLEAAGHDLGAVDAGWVDNFAFGKLVIEPGTRLKLSDALDNRLDGPANEAVYVDELLIGPIDFHDVHLYYRNGGANKRLIYGDTNLSGAVDYEDYKAILRNFGRQNANWATGDFDFDGDVDYEDYKTILANFGATSTGPPVVLPPDTPEPTTLLLLLFGAAPLALRRGRR